MSKYNLIDIYEQYKIGSGWTTDFDYDGMLKAGLKTGVDTDLELLKKMVEDYTDVNYHREAHHLYNAIEALEDGAIKEASMFFGDFHAEINQTIKDQGMDIEPTVGQFMASKMEEEMAVFSSEEEEDKYIEKMVKRGLEKEKAKEPRDGVKSAAAKLGMKPKHVKEVSSREGSRMEGLVDQRMKAKLLEIFADLYFDLTDEDPFQAEDVVDYLGIEMLKHLDAIQAQGDKLAGVNTDADFGREQRMQMDMREEEMSLEDIVKSTKVDGTMEDLEKAVMAQAKKSGLDVTDKEVEDAVEKHADMALGLMNEEEMISKDDIKKALKGTKVEIETYMDSLKRSGDKFDSIEDYVEDFENYVADKSLQEHFGRFMKDYQ